MFQNNTDFYPTPKKLIKKMLEGIDLTKVRTILEPSAGKGDIAKFLLEMYLKETNSYYKRSLKPDLDVIELDPNLRHILKGEKFRVIHDNFLTFHSYKSYDLVVMNPPFSNGERHLLKALELQERGGQIVCLLNAETIRNPYSNTRKILVKKLEEYNASIEYLEDTFLDAERKTAVEVALIKVSIPVKKRSFIIEGLKKEKLRESSTESWSNDLVIGEFLERIVAHYNFEVKAGAKLIDEYAEIAPKILKSLGKDAYNSEILTLSVNGENYNGNNEQLNNEFIKSVNYKYWKALFSSEQFTKLFTSKLRSEYYDKIKELSDYDFSLYNIYSIQADLSKSLLKSVEDTIIELFDEFSHKHSWYDETSKNIHYFDGWKTNKSWKINKKVIIPLSGYDTFFDKRYNCSDYRVVQKLSDIEKALCYLDGGIVNHEELTQTLRDANECHITKKIQLKYFTVTFYKKGTCHIEFTNQELLDKFNLYGSQKKGWLPPSYGKKDYEDMTGEEQLAIDNFQGKDAYAKILKEKAYYLSEQTPLSLGLPELPELPTPAPIQEEEETFQEVAVTKAVEENVEENVSTSNQVIIEMPEENLPIEEIVDISVSRKTKLSDSEVIEIIVNEETNKEHSTFETEETLEVLEISSNIEPIQTENLSFEVTLVTEETFTSTKTTKASKKAKAVASFVPQQLLFDF